ncbi:hypothetical protein THRCLA_02460 [Thraustotheca clavata]|uniref:non-specific serine/threonine protein kinase n=1 Tax=Thraustotheca clavata TaxID=74557 RepID=A0A1W0A531_9STRA|nr:hypothetical protein THRCLA_02460 [Thraustotheca clavata]
MGEESHLVSTSIMFLSPMGNCCGRPKQLDLEEKEDARKIEHTATEVPLEDSDGLSTPPQSPRTDLLSPPINLRNSLVASHPFEDIYVMDTENKLGEGATAVVYVAINKRTLKHYAVKCFDKSKMNATQVNDLYEEVKILKRIKHPNVLQLYDFFEEPTHFYIVTDLLEGGELFDRIVDKEYYSEKEARDLIKIMLFAIRYLHDLNIVHRDLKPENVLLTSRSDDTSIKIADFGYAKEDFDGQLTEKCGSPDYIAPEILSRAYYGKQVDIWSAGIISYILLCGYPPFQGRNNAELFNSIKKGAFEFDSPYWDDVSVEAKQFVSRMLVVDPKKRATVDELLSDPWITGDVSSAPLNGVMTELRRFNARRKFRAAVKTVQATVSLLGVARSRGASSPTTPPARSSDVYDPSLKAIIENERESEVATVLESGDGTSSGLFRDNYTLGGMLGEGSYAIVKKARSRSTGNLCAVKIFKKENLSVQDDEDIHKEVQILQRLNHPNVIRLLDFYSEPKYYYLVTELVEGGELFERIALMEYYSEKEARDLVKTLLEAIEYCHGLDVAHRDLKPENILMTSKDDNANIKIADFGFAKQDTNGLSTTCGSPEYVAPEIINQATYGKSVDIWSIGVITYVLLAGYTPFHDPNQSVLFDNICNARFYFYEPDWNEVSQEAKDFVTRALDLDSSKRPTASQLLKDPWIVGQNVSARALVGVMEKLPDFNKSRRKFRAAVQATMLVNILNRDSSGKETARLAKMLRRTLGRTSIWRIGQLKRASMSTVQLGGITATKATPTEPQLVPTNYLVSPSQETLGHLRWMLQKDILQQDMFLIGPPGPARRHLAMQFAEMLNREVEYVAISQDTTESDLKQRREILNGASIFTDQAPVRAAVHGRLLILDGLEKAERNVLPTLNNLLENREMALEDGRFLMKAESFDALLNSGHTLESLAAQNLVRVHQDFRVIALGLPVPPYPGRSLDPPLRSRFQARRITPPSPGNLLDRLMLSSSAGLPLGEKLVAFGEAAHVVENMSSTSGGNSNRMPHLSSSSIERAMIIASNFPKSAPIHDILHRVYPTHLWAEHKEAAERIVNNLFPKHEQIQNVAHTYDLKAKESFQATLLVGEDAPVDISCGILGPNMNPLQGYIESSAYQSTLFKMLQDHAVGYDMCILGSKGSGKSGLAWLFGHRLGYPTELFTLFQDMSSRDLYQRRATDDKGNTLWEDSPLMHAARMGHVAILDGIHRLHCDTLATLQRLMQDREIDLADGTKFIDHRKYLNDGNPKVQPIHPAFRIICLAETSKLNKAPAWLTSESLSMMSFHSAPVTNAAELTHMLLTLCPSLPQIAAKALVKFWEKIEHNSEVSLSLRQLLRFLGPNQARVIHQALKESLPKGIPTDILSTSSKPDAKLEIVATPTKVSIGDVEYNIPSQPKRPELVPQPLYFDIPKHTYVIQQVLKDTVAGQRHLLLIGNQGVGKNKVVDRALQLMAQEREYVQLHRDTTVQTLTLVPTLTEGKIIWEDSPLVRAVKEGRTLVVDEADKAPLEVVCVLKGLIEDGEMLLGDGRRIIDPEKVKISDKEANKVIEVHPNFRMWVLANRPGYPFLGNNFFSEIGDIFASHSIDNPDLDSELALLQAYAPSVPEEVLRRLCSAFADLRQLVEDGTITYPYSTREVIAVAKHLERFPEEGVTGTLENVLAFDSYDPQLRKLLASVFVRHGIPLSPLGERQAISISLAPIKQLPAKVLTDTWQPNENDRTLESTSNKLKTRRVYLEPPVTRTFGVDHHRTHVFSEQVSSWDVPLWQRQKTTSMAVLPNQSVHVVTKQPLGLHSYFNVDSSKERTHLYSELEDSYSYARKSTPMVYPFGDNLLLHVPSADLVLIMNEKHDVLQSFVLPSLSAKNSSRTVFGWKSDRQESKLVPEFEANRVLLYHPLAKSFLVVDLSTGEYTTILTPFEVESLDISPQSNVYRVQYSGRDNKQHLINCSNLNAVTQKTFTTTESHTQTLTADKNYLVNPNSVVQIIEHNPNGKIQVWSIPRDKEAAINTCYKANDRLLTAFMDQIEFSVVELDQNTSKIIPTPASNDKDAIIAMSTLGNDLLTLQLNGTIRRWQVDNASLSKELDNWKAMFDYETLQGHSTPLTLYDGDGVSTPKTDSSLPKYGKEDPDNKPHVGGNTWAGGTGGSDTAGLGGRGGPYRLDKGHKVHQVSQAKKDEVTEEARKKAKAMADEALAAKLQDIEMTGGEWKAYQKYLNRIEQETSQLRNVLQNLESIEKERGWLKHQSSGEWDDAKLVDGIAGERNVFKRRGTEDQMVVACIASMAKIYPFYIKIIYLGNIYRFNLNFFHGRLERMLETTMMVMEAFTGYEDKVEYAIMGHSGDSAKIPFVEFGQAPKDRKQRLKILQKMLAHSQYCSSGDHTVEAIHEGVQKVVHDHGDEYFVFVVSDANLDRYGIHPEVLGRELTVDNRVQAHAIFIASIADEATRILHDLPTGHGHVCLNTADLPSLFKKMFTASLDKSK